jgi:hypothetical protein
MVELQIKWSDITACPGVVMVGPLDIRAKRATLRKLADRSRGLGAEKKPALKPELRGRYHEETVQ